MPNDIEYSASTTLGSVPDNVVGTDNNYQTITGARSKVARVVMSEWKDVDGEGFGNKAWKLLEREQDTQGNRTLLEFHTMQAIKPLIDAGEIRDVEITTGDPANAQGVGMLIKFFDVREGDESTHGFIAPWGKS